MKPEYRRRFGDPVPAFVTLFSVALPVSAAVTAAADEVGFSWRYSAAAPATCGDAIDVPPIVAVAVLLVHQADVIPLPGPKMSRHVPMFENDALASLIVVAPTVIADAALAGE